MEPSSKSSTIRHVFVLLLAVVAAVTGIFARNVLEVRGNDKGKKVAVWIDDTKHYQIRGPTADEEFDSLAPPVNPENGEFSPISMIHQLQCLQIIRREYADNKMSFLSEHCMQYLRQSILCAADTRLESVRFSKPPHVVALPGEYECSDWTAISM